VQTSQSLCLLCEISHGVQLFSSSESHHSDTARSSLNLYTIGHSNRSIDEFLALLRAHGIKQLVDVRTAAGSRKNPQFMTGNLARSLAADSIRYTHLPALGGFRKPRPDSINSAWRNESFRGYADYMQTPEFDAALATLLDLAAREPTAIMCAEAVPWRCHRSLIADAVVARGLTTGHIVSPTRCNPHTLTSFARVENGRVTYPVEC
jgi:uncharacterized protein (DUF488 family)